MEFNRENYRAYNAINYSTLSTLQKNPSQVNSDDVWNDGIAFGSMVDILCFEPETFDEQFYVSNADREPSTTAKKLADWILENYPNLDLVDEDQDSVLLGQTNNYDNIENLNDLLKQAKDVVGSSTNFKRYGGVDYLKEQLASKDKHVISQEEYDKATTARNTLLSHRFSRDFFTPQSNNVEIVNQFPILWNLESHGIDKMGKCLLDIVRINHQEKTIEPVDLKTTSYWPNQFESQFLKWSYYLQASYYYYAMCSIVEQNDKYNDYTVLPFTFVVLSKKDLYHPYIYTTNTKLLECGKDGGHIERWDTEVRGWTQLIKDLLWHQKNNKWEYSREIYESNGQVELNVFK